MANPLLIVVESIRRLAGLRHLAGGLPPLVQLAAAVSTLLLVAVSLVTFLGGVILGGSDGQESSGTATPQDGASDDPLEVLTPKRLWILHPGYFDFDASGLSVVQNISPEYDPFEFGESPLHSVSIRPVGVGEGDIFLTEFTVTNASERERAIIRAVSLQIEEFEPAPDRLRVGCVTGLGGGMEQEIITFEMQLDSESVGVEQPVPTVPAPGTVLELGPDDLQAFRAYLTFSAPGVHRFTIAVHYDTSAGRSATAVSEPVEVLLMPSVQSVEGVRPVGSGLGGFECRPGEAESLEATATAETAMTPSPEPGLARPCPVSDSAVCELVYEIDDALATGNASLVASHIEFDPCVSWMLIGATADVLCWTRDEIVDLLEDELGRAPLRVIGINVTDGEGEIFLTDPTKSSEDAEVRISLYARQRGDDWVIDEGVTSRDGARLTPSIAWPPP